MDYFQQTYPWFFIVLAVSKISATIYANRTHYILGFNYIPVLFVSICNISQYFAKCRFFPTNSLILSRLLTKNVTLITIIFLIVIFGWEFFMSKSNTQVKEQRCAERMSIGESVEFRCNSDEDFRTATMVDFSEAGMLLLIKEEYPEGSQFEVRVKEDEALYFTVKCVRALPCADVDMYGYGCTIEDHRIAPE